MAKPQPQQPAAPPTPPQAAAPAAKPSTPVALLEKIKADVAQMSREDIEKAVVKAREQKEKFKKYAKEHPLTDEQKAKQKARAKEYMNRPEVKEKMKAYIQRPEVRERMKAQSKLKREQQKAILARAKELGITA